MEKSSLETDPPTIVMVDDNWLVLEAATMVINLYLPGWEIKTTSRTGPGLPYQAKEIANQLTGPALFLVDYHMPKVNGLQLIEQLRPYLLVQAKFMLVTAETDHKVYIQAHKMGVEVFCKQPPPDGSKFNFGELFIAKIEMMAGDLSTMVEKSVDEITGAYTMRGFGDQWVQMSNVMKRDRTWAALIFFDVNDFKVINDLYQEHEPGNKILQAIYKAASQHLRKVDPIGRKGDEFFVAIQLEIKEFKGDGMTRKTAPEIEEEVKRRAHDIGQRIAHSVSELRVEVLPGQIRETSISFGVAVVDPMKLRENPDSLREVAIEEMKGYLKQADQASYADKFANYERRKGAGDKDAEKKYLYYKELREKHSQASSS
ncbi:MAG: diguanylate cyclase [Candidatus Paceibacterota bacterium]